VAERPQQRVSLRERQRVALEAELRAVALRLFRERGFDDVSVSEIASEAGVSERTFFRYFPTKEEAVLRSLERFGPDIMGALQEQPLDRSWFDILRGVYTGVNEEPYNVAGDRTADVIAEAGEIMRLAAGSARLQSGLDARLRIWADDVAQGIAARLGVGVDDDPRPRLWAAVTIAVVSTETIRRAVQGLPLGGPAMRDAWEALRELMVRPGAQA
jgi:AcrR family transcriptional regulator